MKVVLTGADGHIGRAATTAFAEADWHVVGVGLGERPESTSAAEWITADLAADGIPPEALEGCDAVVHLAAIPGRFGSDRDVFRNNVCATFNVLDSAGAAGVPRAVFASSISAYGLVWSDARVVPPEIPLSESTPLTATESYSLSKEVDEATARMMSRRYGTSIAALRFPLVVGERETRERAELVLADPAEAHKELWAYLLMDDATRALIAAATADFEGVLVANVVSPQALGGIDAVAEAARWFPETPIAAGAASSYSTDVARERLGFTASSIFPETARPRA